MNNELGTANEELININDELQTGTLNNEGKIQTRNSRVPHPLPGGGKTFCITESYRGWVLQAAISNDEGTKNYE